MYFTHRSIRAATAVLVVWTFSYGTAFAQTVSSRVGARGSFLLASLPSAPERCAKGMPNPAVPRADAEVAGDSPSSCGPAPVAIPEAKPCDPTGEVRSRCDDGIDPMQASLLRMGKNGRKISRAREKVLEILGTENACSAWFREKDSNPAASFRTLRFEVDFHGQEFVREIRELGAFETFRSPYVARVIQGDGPYGTVTINWKGAFFTGLAQVMEMKKEGGPRNMRGTRSLHVGPYEGDTLSAQIATLLHEFGHIIDLLPMDQDDLDGKSTQNTREVLRYCLPEIKVRTGKP